MKESLYLKLYENLRLAIIDGIYPSGAKLPSKRTLADKWGVSLITVMHALDLLIDEGYIVSKERSGYFVSFKKGDFLSSAPLGFGEVKIGAFAKAEFPFPLAAKIMRKVISDYGEAILLPSANMGCPELKGAICEYLARARGIKTGCDNIIIGSGAEYLYGLVIKLLGMKRIYGIEDPSYMKIEKVYRANGAECRLLKLGNNGIESFALESTDADVLHISPYRSFPSGVSADISKRTEYLRFAERKNGIIIEDDFESEFSVGAKPAETVYSMSDKDNVIYINTFSKTVSPALRVGYMVLPDKLLKVYREKLGFYACTVPCFEQYFMATLIKEGDFERQINRVRRRLKKQKNG